MSPSFNILVASLPYCEQSEHSWSARVHRLLHSLGEDQQTSEQNSKPVQRRGWNLLLRHWKWLITSNSIVVVFLIRLIQVTGYYSTNSSGFLDKAHHVTGYYSTTIVPPLSGNKDLGCYCHSDQKASSSGNGLDSESYWILFEKKVHLLMPGNIGHGQRRALWVTTVGYTLSGKWQMPDKLWYSKFEPV